MKTTKQPTNNLEKFRGIFFQIGIIVATSLTFLAFEWTTPVRIADFPNPDIEVEGDFEIPIITYRSDPKKVDFKPVAPKVDITKINIVTVDPIDPTEPDPYIDPLTNPVFVLPIEKVIEEEAPLPSAGKMPYYNTCESSDELIRKKCTEEAMFKHFRKTLKVPELIKALGKADYTAHVYFEVDKKGLIRNVKVMNKGRIHYLLEQEAIKAVSSLPDLLPAINHGKAVSVYYSIPIKFSVRE